MSCTFRIAIEHKDTGVDRGALVEGGPDRPVQPVLQIQGSLVLHHVREKVTEKRGILSQQRLQVQGALGGHQLIQPDRTRRQRGPVLWRGVTVLGVRAPLAHSFEYHHATLGTPAVQRKYRRTASAGCSQTVTICHVSAAPAAAWEGPAAADRMVP